MNRFKISQVAAWLLIPHCFLFLHSAAADDLVAEGLPFKIPGIEFLESATASLIAMAGSDIEPLQEIVGPGYRYTLSDKRDPAWEKVCSVTFLLPINTDMPFRLGGDVYLASKQIGKGAEADHNPVVYCFRTLQTHFVNKALAVVDFRGSKCLYVLADLPEKHRRGWKVAGEDEEEVQVGKGVSDGLNFGQ